jgi:uncharacterized protein
MFASNKTTMILQNTLEQVIDQQRERLNNLNSGLKRELAPNFKSISSHALVITGIRRCGKSTLMLQLMQELKQSNHLYLNFESPLLYGFSINDFQRLDAIIRDRNTEVLFLDELQQVDKWELYVREKLDQGLKVIVTGSNASLLSNELGTKLTGRHIKSELFPFSFNEFTQFKALKASSESLQQYMKLGGFPEYLKTNDEQQLTTLFDDIIIRDIVARYGVKDIKSIQRLASFLISNIGNRITASKLKQPLAIGATSTVLSWFSHLEMSYLFSFIPMFSHSTKAQLINPRKLYTIDPGMLEAISTKHTSDLGQKLENLIFLHLRRHFNEIYYFDNKGKGECDFIAIDHGTIKKVVQVTLELTPDNTDREIKGIIDALQFFNLTNGTIVTLNQHDRITEGKYIIDVVPAHEFLAN